MWLMDPVSKKKSVTLTLFVVGYTVAIIKLMISGIKFGSFEINFSGGEFAAVVGALGGIYAIRRIPDKGKKDDSSP
jgi:hypothetical protein